jgi:hypothetical protein
VRLISIYCATKKAEGREHRAWGKLLKKKDKAYITSHGAELFLFIESNWPGQKLAKNELLDCGLRSADCGMGDGNSKIRRETDTS